MIPSYAWIKQKITDPSRPAQVHLTNGYMFYSVKPTTTWSEPGRFSNQIPLTVISVSLSLAVCASKPRVQESSPLAGPGTGSLLLLLLLLRPMDTGQAPSLRRSTRLLFAPRLWSFVIRKMIDIRREENRAEGLHLSAPIRAKKTINYWTYNWRLITSRASKRK